MSAMATRLQAWPVEGIGEITEGTDLAGLLPPDLADGDVVVMTSKVVSKAEGRVRPGDRQRAERCSRGDDCGGASPREELWLRRKCGCVADPCLPSGPFDGTVVYERLAAREHARPAACSVRVWGR